MSSAFLQALRESFNESQVLTDQGECLSYGYDATKITRVPIAVVFVESNADVITLITLCNSHQVPLTARGKGSGQVGGCVPCEQGVVVSFERMSRVLKFDTANRYIEVEAGITNSEVQRIVGEKGFFWAPDPSSSDYASVGGNLAHNAAGPRAVKYGTTRENTLGLTAVTGAGQVLQSGVHTTKGVVGYDFTRLLIGSQGTLALITSATLRLLPIAKSKATLRVCFDSIEGATQAIVALMGQSVIPCALELMDANCVNLLRIHTDLAIPERANAMMIIEIDAQTDDISQHVLDVKTTLASDSLLEYQSSQNEDEVRQLWQARKALSPILRNFAPKKINEDIVVPVAQIPALFKGLESISQDNGIPILNFGHAGNGNIHVNMMVDLDNPQQAANVDACLQSVFSLVLSLDGTLSGEHGTGLAKRDFVAQELDAYSIEMMHRVKGQFDPNGILNPDKMPPNNSYQE